MRRSAQTKKHATAQIKTTTKHNLTKVQRHIYINTQDTTQHKHHNTSQGDGCGKGGGECEEREDCLNCGDSKCG